jgi:NifB/MoaA-like Fe-S oxidoreductase
LHFVHASDEWYMLAGLPLPEEESYDGYLQLENGVGMLRLFLDEFEDACQKISTPTSHKEVSIATGKLAYPTLVYMADKLMERVNGLKIHVYAVENEFFGTSITVSGLLTGQDVIAQLQGKPLGQSLLLPENILRSGEDVFLDDVRVGDVEKALQVSVNIVKSSGYELVETILK